MSMFVANGNAHRKINVNKIILCSRIYFFLIWLVWMDRKLMMIMAKDIK
jgi:hypothetical protein